MFIDWNGNGEFDPSDLALSLAILDDERRREEKLRREQEEEETDNPARSRAFPTDFSLRRGL